MRSQSVVLVGAIGGLVVALATGATARAAVPRSSGVITVRGDAHTYLTEGQGEPCIVVGFAPQYPPLFSARLKQRIKFLYVDFKNSWASEGSIDSVTMDSLVEEVDDVRKGFGLERACIIGHSSTGLIAIEYAARHPRQTSRVILIGVHPFWDSKQMSKWWGEFWESDASPQRKAALAVNKSRMPDSTLNTFSPREAFALRYVRNGPRLFYDPSYDFYWAWIGHRFSAQMLDRFWNVIVADYNPWNRLTGNTVPMFVALGRFDYAVPYRWWDQVKGRVPNLTFAMFEKSAHFPMLEQQKQFDEAVLRWLPPRRDRL